MPRKRQRTLACLVTFCLWTAALPSRAEEHLEGLVVGIADGDTLTLLVGQTQHRIRLAEIDTPEAGQDWADRARQALSGKVFRQHVTVYVTDTDRYGRLVGKVLLGARDINREMVREGHAWVYRKYLVDVSLLDEEAAARASELGLWGLNDPIPPWEFRHHASARDSRDAAPGCKVKGNISSKGTKIYHVPGQRHYDVTRIDPARGERMFCSEAEARQAGWRPARG
jgi:endonuclease YncB( thermonuclease family)